MPSQDGAFQLHVSTDGIHFVTTFLILHRCALSGLLLYFYQVRFELCDLDARCLPYPSNSYDVVHARNMHTGVCMVVAVCRARSRTGCG